MNLWPLFDEEWKESIKGTSSIYNCLYFNLFNQALKEYKNDTKLIYLLENQSWEFALIQAWRKNQSKEIIGYAHSSICYWDLRKYFSHKTFEIPNFPFPDKVGINGNLSKSFFKFNNSIENKIIDLEATRYLYLKNLKDHNRKNDLIYKNNLLVICDYSEYHSKKQLDLLSEISKYLNNNFSIKIKPHPGKVNSLEVPDNINYTITNLPISNLVNEVDVVFTSNTTSAAIEFFYLDKYVISMIDDSALNLSPLRGIKDIDFVFDSNGLKSSLDKYKIQERKSYKDPNLLYLDNKLPNWLNLLQDKNL